MNWDDPIWMLLAANTGIASVFTLGLFQSKNLTDWRTSVRNWVSSKTVWIGTLSLFWMLGWIGFLDGTPDTARIAYMAILGLFTLFHAIACKEYLMGEASS